MKKLFFAAILSIIFVSAVSAQSMFRKISDFDGDGKTDFVITRNENDLKVWHVWQSKAGYKRFQWGLNSDRTVLGDYDGDGKTDFAVYREIVEPPGTAYYTFYIFQSKTQSLLIKVVPEFRFNFNSPIPQDYDGDGKTDPAVWLGEFGLRTTIRGFFSTTNSIFNTDIPASHHAVKIGDMNGDGRADKAYYRMGVHDVTISSLDKGKTRTIHFGTSNDTYLFADFDGDGTGDLSVWRNSDGDWYWLRSSDSVIERIHWGISGDRPVPGDYDGDGKTDQAVWRSGAPNGIYYVNGSQSGFQTFTWGVPNDSAVRY